MIKLSPQDEALVRIAQEAVKRGAEAVVASRDTETLRNSLYRLSEHVLRAEVVVREAEDRTRERELSRMHA